MAKRGILMLVAALMLGVVVFTGLAWKASIAPIEAPPSSQFSADVVAHGEQLAGAGFCATCHTRTGGAAYAGGRPMVTGFGTIYSTNITPDPTTGIGDWSEAAFRRALREGVARDGSHLFPAFPFDHYTQLTDADIKALYAYLMTRPPVVAETPANSLPFPLGWRPLQAGWKLLFLRSGEYQPHTDQSAEWNRGAYLAESLSHCGACHTPRNAVGAERHDQPYAGAVIDDWVAPPLNADNPAPAPWDLASLKAYLGSGVSALHGTAAGPMAPVVHGLAKLPESDINALAVYFASLNGSAAKEAGALQAVARARATDGARASGPDAALYQAACASCHYNRIEGTPDPLRPDLPLNSALLLDDPLNLIQVILHGINAADGAPGIVMPGFAHFSNAEVARLAAWLRAHRTERPPWPDLERKVAEVRAQSHQ